MSSRALRRLKGEDELVIPGLEAENSSEQDEEEINPIPVSKKNKKKNKTKPQPVNPFDLLNEEADISPVEDDVRDVEDEPDMQHDNEASTETADQQEAGGKPKKKKKKKKKKNKAVQDENKPTADQQDGEEDEIDASVREVNAMLGELPAGQSVGAAMPSVPIGTRALLTVEHKYLNPDNEMRRIFGSRVVQAEQRGGAGGAPNRGAGPGGRRGVRTLHRNTWLVRARDNWPHTGKSGLTMTIMETTSANHQIFTFEHSTQYQQAQFAFWDAVESLNPQNIVSVLNAHPYHIDSMLQLSEVCRMSEDVQMATELIERSLFQCECSFHPLFNISSGNCRLEYRRQENRALFVSLFRHIMFVGQRGCYRTALELCKVLLSMDPEGDPLCVLLMIDFYALKSDQYDFLIRLYHEWEMFRNLSQLPNFAFSVPLAMFHTHEDTTHANNMLQSALLMFPGVLMPLLDACSITPDPSVASHAFFTTNAQLSEPEALKQLMALFIGRSHPCWKAPEVMTWLERNVKDVLHLVDNADPRVKDFADKRKQRYQGTPRNIYRHILLSEIKDATAALPPELSSSPVLSYDPLPPKDAITSYTRPTRRRVVDQDSSALSMFFRSLLPNFNPDEIVDDLPEGAAGAAGGADLRQGIGNLMDAMRDLLNNIQPAPAPREDEHEDGENLDHLDEFD